MKLIEVKVNGMSSKSKLKSNYEIIWEIDYGSLDLKSHKEIDEKSHTISNRVIHDINYDYFYVDPIPYLKKDYMDDNKNVLESLLLGYIRGKKLDNLIWK